MSRQAQVVVGLIGVSMSVLLVLLLVGIQGSASHDGSSTSGRKQTSDAQASPLVRDDSWVLNGESAQVTFVEFLDFECEACGAAFPMIERLRERYTDQVRFVVRYFPIDSHYNARRAAHAVEAAGRQGKFEEMYQLMYTTQKQWAEQQVALDEVFLAMAAQLALDMDRFRTDYTSDDVAARVQRDVDDGLALGVQGTPTFFLDGERLEPQSYEDLTAAIDAALA